MGYSTDYLKQPKIEYKEVVRKNIGVFSNEKCIVYGGKTGPNLVRLTNFTKIAKQLPHFKFIVIGASEAARFFLKDLDIPNLLIFPFVPYQKYIEPAHKLKIDQNKLQNCRSNILNLVNVL